jgi:predicted Mrr-cat superfamily restriction endonuclease
MNYWLVSAGKDGELWPAFWLEKLVAIGWSNLGDLRQYPNRHELEAAYRKWYPKNSSRKRGANVGRLWDFYKRILPGELVFVRSYAALIGIGEVQDGYDFVAANMPLRQKLRSPFFGDGFPHIRRVRWLSLGGGMKQSAALTRLTLMP